MTKGSASMENSPEHTASSGTSTLDVQIDDGIAIVTLAHPPVNAIDSAWLVRFEEALDALERTESVRVLRVRSNQRVFCAGADLDFMRAHFASESGRKQIIDFTRHMQTVYARLEAADFASIAQIGGAALGGGFELALACDLRVITAGASVGLPEARLGLLPAGGGTQRLVRIVGDALARRLILGAERVDGADAVTLGLAHWLVPSAELESFTDALARRIAQLPRAALAACKRCIAGACDPASDGFALELANSAALLALPETQQRVRRFLDQKQ